MRLSTNRYLNPSDVTIWEVVVQILGLLDRVEESNGPYTNTLPLLVLHNPDQLLGIEDSNPVEQLIIVPCGTSRPMLSQQLGRFDDGWMCGHC
jgi:hypothetical protein